MTQTQRTWNVGEVVKGEDYKHMPAGVFAWFRGDTSGVWLAGIGNEKIQVSNGRIDPASAWYEPRVIIARPANAPAHIPVYAPNDMQEQIRMLDKIKKEAEALIAERDALKQDLRKARDACKTLREERDEARRAANWKPATRDMPAHVPMPAAFTPEAGGVIHKGQKIDTPAQYDALPPGSRVRKANGQCWEKGDKYWWSSDCDGKMRDLAFPRTVLRIGYDDNVHTCLPSKPVDKPVLRVGDVLRTGEDYERAPVGTTVGYHGDCDSSRFYWEKTEPNKWEDRDAASPYKPKTNAEMSEGFYADRKVTRIGPEPTRFHVGQVISTREEYEALPIGSRVEYVWSTGDQPSHWEKTGNGKWAVPGGVSLATMQDGIKRKILRIGTA